jgi:hypothetical protein
MTRDYLTDWEQANTKDRGESAPRRLKSIR